MGGQGPSDTRESEFSLGRSGSKIAGRACYPLALVGCLCLNVEGHVISPVTENGVLFRPRVHLGAILGVQPSVFSGYLGWTLSLVSLCKSAGDSVG